MITAIRRQCIVFAITLLSFLTYSHAQDLRTFNQNSSRSNNTKAYNQNSARSNHPRGLSISLSPVYSTATNSSSDSLLFRGGGAGFRVGADYFFGKAGISFSSGFGSSSPADATINNFLKQFPIPPDQLTITKGKQQNMYLLLGPSVRFGNKVELYAHAKGGLFINNSGLVSIQQKGAQRAAYRNESSSKSVYPGFLTGIGIQYKSKSDVWSFGIGADYMSTKSEVNNYDVRRGGGIEALKLSRNITDIVTGITVRYNIFSARDHSSGQSNGRRVLPTVNKREAASSRDAASGLATGKTYQPGKPVYGNITREEENTGNCGPVTTKITNPDGSVEEMTFSCPDDAANYTSKMKVDGGMPNRISMNVTVPKQTQGATFGEKVNQGLHAAGGALAQGASLSIISGTLTWGSANTGGIVTNKAIYNGNTTRGGSTTMNSQTSSTRQTNQSSFGTMVRLSARDHASGQATGKRSREKGSGMATGRRQYEPIFAEGQNDVCNECPATAKMSGAKSNPLYSDKGVSGENPFYEANKRTAGGEDEDCDGVAAADIFLIDAGSGAVIAKTKTEECGDFFFANVPEGNYVVKVSGSFTGKKGYDVYLNPKTIGSKTDLVGGITATDDWDVQLLINTSKGNDEMTQKAGISTSRSNIRSKSLTIIEADLDGDGEYESLKATGTFSDGSTRDITTAARKTISNAPGTKGIVLDGNAFQMTRRRVEVLKSNKQGDPNANRLTSILVTTGSRLTAIGTFSDGSTRDITEGLISNTDHQGVKQYNITVGDSDDDGIADAVIKSKTKSNQSNDRMANEDADDDKGLINAKAKITKSRSNIQNNRVVNDEEEDTDGNNGLINAKTKISKSRSNIQNNRMINDEEEDAIRSPRSNIKMLEIATGDADGDGKADLVSGNKLKNYFEKGDKPTESQRRPGDPIPGLDVKLGKNPGGQALQTTTSNENGEFEFTRLEAGDYTIIVEQKIFIEDETFVVLVGNNTRAQDHNSSRSNKSGIVDNDPDNGDDAARKGWDGTIKGGSKTKSQDHNSSRSNKSGIIDNDPDNGDDAARKGWDGTIKGGSKTKSQDHNSSRSNKSGIVDNDPDNGDDIRNNTSPVKWMAPELFKRTVNTSRSNIKNVLASLDDLEEQINADATNERYLVNTSRSNIKSQRLAAYDLSEKLADIEFMEKEAAMNEVNKKMAAMNMQFLALQKSLSEMGRQYTTISNVLKTKHESAMASIRNMK